MVFLNNILMTSISLHRCLILLLLLPFVTQGSQNNDMSDRLNDVITPYYQYGMFQGSVLISKGEEIIFQRGNGNAHKQNNKQNHPNTPFRIGSLTKTFTSLIVLQLIEEDRLSLSQSLHSVLPDFDKDKGQKITLRHLLQHTSGIPGHFELPGWSEGLYQQDFSKQKWIEIISKLPLSFEPGLDYQYGNLNYLLLGQMIEKVTGKTFAQNVSQRIFEPSGMKRSGVEPDNTFPDHQVQGYMMGKGKGHRVQHRLNMQVFDAGANIYSTVRDLHRFNKALFSGQLISDDLLAFWLREDNRFSLKKYQLEQEDGQRVQWLTFGGQLQGFSSIFSRFSALEPVRLGKEKQDISIIILSNNGLSSLTKRALTLDLIDAIWLQTEKSKKVKKRIPVTFIIQKAALENDLGNQAAQILNNKHLYDVVEANIDELAQHYSWAGASLKALQVWSLNSQLYPQSDRAKKRLRESCLPMANTKLIESLCQ